MSDLYFNEKMLLITKKEHKIYVVLLSDNGSLWIPTPYEVLDLGSERISSCLIAKEDL